MNKHFTLQNEENSLGSSSTVLLKHMRAACAYDAKHLTRRHKYAHETHKCDIVKHSHYT